MTDLLKLCGSSTTRASTVSKIQPELWSAIIGKLLWLALIRSDIAYATKKQPRDLTAPTTESITKVKHLLRYIVGTKDHCQRLCPNVTLESSNCALDLDCYVDRLDRM